MGTFTISCTVQDVKHPQKARRIGKILVDTGSELTWIAEPVLEAIGIARQKKDLTVILANGQTVTRAVGFAIIRVNGAFTVDEVVFAEPRDLQLLGARTLEGLGLTVDSRRKKLVAAGPITAASGVTADHGPRSRSWR